jgi:hypothetical protein
MCDRRVSWEVAVGEHARDMCRIMIVVVCAGTHADTHIYQRFE